MVWLGVAGIHGHGHHWRHVVNGLVVRDQLLRDFSQDFLGQTVRIFFVLSERHELHDVTHRLFAVRAQSAVISVQDLHARKVSTADTNNDDRDWVI
jgi:hypothetical protein